MFEVESVMQRRWSGTLDPKRLTDVLNRRHQDGWKFTRSITSSSRVWLFFKREAVFLIFEKP